MMKNRLAFKIVLTVGILFSGLVSVHSQSLRTGGSHVVLPSSKSWNGTNGSNADVNLYTGAFNHVTPLHTLTSRDLSIPISIHYSAGVRVDDLASETGLGMQLSAGGSIGRVMRGLPDEFDGPYVIQLAKDGQAEVTAKGFLHPNVGDYADKDYFISASLSEDDRKRVVEFSNRTGDFISLGANPEVWDTEPDEFYFNFDRYSGKFVFDKNGEIQIIPHQNLLITKITQSNLYPATETGNTMITSFQITDDRGIKYTFGNVNPTSQAGMTAIDVTRYSVLFRWFQLAFLKDAAGTFTNSNGAQVNLFVRTPTLLVSDGVPHIGINFVNNKQTFTSSWHLSKIESPTGDFIDLAYRNEEVHYLTGRTHDVSQPALDGYWVNETAPRWGTYVHNDISFSTGPMGQQFHGQMFTVGTTKSTVNSKKLLSITAATGEKASFESVNFRDDLVGGMRLDRVIIFNSGNQEVKSYTLNYDLLLSPREDYYFMFKHPSVSQAGNFVWPYEANGVTWQNFIFPAIPEGDQVQNGWASLLDADHARLLLSNITEKTNGKVRPLVTFEYDQSYSLPPRLSQKQDKFGYYNDNSVGHSFVRATYSDTNAESQQLPMDFLSVFFGENGELYFRDAGYASMGTNGEKAAAWSIKNIIHRNGSKTTIYYAFDKGLRVARIMNFADKDSPLAEDVTYSYSNQQSLIFQDKNHILFPVKLVGVNLNKWRFVVQSSGQPINQPFNTTKGALSGYAMVQRVSAHSASNGTEVFEFSAPGTDPDQGFVRYNTAGGQLAAGDEFPYAPKSSFDHRRGLLKKYTVKDKNDKTVKTETYVYNFNPNGYQPKITYGLKPGKHVFNDAPIFTASFYKYTSDWVYLDYVETKLYDQSDPGNEAKRAVTKVQYYYTRPGETTPVTDLLARKTLTTLPDGDVMGNEFKYPTDYTTATSTDAAAKGIYLLKTKRIESVPIETINYLERLEGSVTNKYLMGASLVKFKEFQTGKVFQWETYKLKAGMGNIFTSYPWSTITSNIFTWSNGVNFKLTHRMDSYDAYGNPLTETGEDGIQNTYVWGHNNALLTSATVNSGAFQHQNTYSYTPLVGVTQVTDPNGRNKKYTYDFFNLLKLEKDHDDQILNRFRYHYKDQAEGFTNLSILKGGCKLPGQQQYFYSLENVLEHGQTTFAWNFGDGGTTTTTTGEGLHVYSLPGTYLITLNKENPEYSTQQLQTTQIIYRPISSVTKTITGPTSYDVCTLYPPSQSTSLKASFVTGVKTLGDAFEIVWDVSYNGGAWNTFSTQAGPVTSSTVSPPPGFGDSSFLGTWEIRCTGRDACGNYFSGTFTLTNYKSNPTCPEL